MKKVFILFAAMMAGLCAMQAQTTFTFHIGGVMPTAKFAESDLDNGEWALINENRKDGGAGLGVDLGLQWNFGIQSVNGLSILFSVDAIANTLNSDVKDFIDDVIDNAEDNGYDDASVTKPLYINIPIMVGATYNYKFNESFGVFGEAALGLNIRDITNLKYSLEAGSYESSQTLDYKLATTVAYRVGAGLVFNDKYTLGISYWNLGAAKVNAKITDEVDGPSGHDKDTEKFKGKALTPTMAMLRVGFRF